MEIEITRGLSIKQPWLQLIIDHYKDIEIRTWKTPYRGWIVLHSGKNFDQDGFIYLQSKGYFKDMMIGEFMNGYILGYANLYDIIDFKNKDHFMKYKDRHLNDEQQFNNKQKGFILTNIDDVYPMRYKASLGLFHLKTPFKIKR